MNNHWKLQAGLRYDYVNYKADGVSKDEFSPIGISTGLVWDPTGSSDYTAGLSLAYTQRAPSISELYANGEHLARQIFELGNSELDTEESYGLDLTIKKNTGIVTGLVNVFAQEYDQYINLSSSNTEVNGLDVFNYESVEAFFWGFETKATLHLHEALKLWTHDLDIDAQLDFVRAKNRSDSSNLPRIPPLRTIVGIDYRYKFLFGARLEGVFVTKQDRTAETELPTDSYQMANAYVNLNIPIRNDYDLAFYLRGTNLTNEEARVHSSFLKDLAPLRARSILLGVRGSF